MKVILPFILSQTLFARVRESFTSNGLCRRKFCVNPIFPGLESLHQLENQEEWQCADLKNVERHLSFCRDVVNYHTSVPKHDKSKAGAFEDAVKYQEQIAMTMYAYHLSAMGLDFWDYRSPADDDPCIKAVWRLTCYTYFPRAPMDCKPDDDVKYIRPCESSCASYVNACGVDCCDESVKCVFEHTKSISADVTIETKGYYPESGPSPRCTGASFRITPLWILLGLGLIYANKRTAILIALVAIMSSLPMVQADFANSHTIGNWQAKPDYLIEYSYVPPGAAAEDALFNSCAIPNLAHSLQCNGHGLCKAWDITEVTNPVRFCECDEGWADPECRTKRKSQTVAYLLALFAGFTGADEWYLGFPVTASAKLCTFGGLGFWWIWDIVRIGSAPVYANKYRVANNLPHWVFVVSSVSFALAIGIILSTSGVMRMVGARRKRAMLLLQEEQCASAKLI